MQVAHHGESTVRTEGCDVRGRLPLLPAGKKTGVLLLHGFTSSLAAVSGLTPILEANGMEYEMPVLRGHGAAPEALIGVRAQDWYDDAYAALEKLSQRVDKIVIVGLSMGGLTALQLCARTHELRPKIAACVTWAAALGFCNPLAWMAKPLSHFIKMWRGQDSFHDPECRKNNENYPVFPTKAFVELYDYAADTRKRLDDVEVPLCIIHSMRDQVVPYKTSKFLFDNAGGAFCERHSLARSGHELGQDCEASHVFELTMDFINRLTGKSE